MLAPTRGSTHNCTTWVLGNYNENNMQGGRADDYPEAFQRREARSKALVLMQQQEGGQH